LKWISFTAEKSGKDVMLAWQIALSQNNSRYDVEHSLDGSRYSNIGRLNADDANTSNYRHIHSGASPAVPNFYRIKQVDKDGRFSYSPVRIVKFNPVAGITVSPNPASNFINVYTAEKNVSISLVDGSGRRMIISKLESGNGQINISQLPRGIYTVVAENTKTIIGTWKILKQ
jgi:Secretion system C-terminal sorting domain